MDLRTEAVLDRFETAIRLLYPEEMTPAAKRALDSIIEAERERSEDVPLRTNNGHPNWLYVRCPFCKVQKGETCMSTGNQPVTAHTQRRKLYADVLKRYEESRTKAPSD